MVRPGGDDEEPPAEPPAAGAADRVDGLPGDDHRHDGGLAGPGRELQGQPRQPRVGAGVGRVEVVEERLRAAARARRDLGDPDQGLDRLDLAEEGPDAAEVVAAPVPQEAGRLRGDLPVARVRQRPPPIHVAAQLVDDGGRVVLLGGRGNPGAVRELQDVLGGRLPPLPGLRDGGDELRPPPLLEDAARRLSFLVQLPMAGRVLVGRVDDRSREERSAHGRLRSAPSSSPSPSPGFRTGRPARPGRPAPVPWPCARAGAGRAVDRASAGRGSRGRRLDHPAAPRPYMASHISAATSRSPHSSASSQRIHSPDGGGVSSSFRTSS